MISTLRITLSLLIITLLILIVFTFYLFLLLFESWVNISLYGLNTFPANLPILGTIFVTKTNFESFSKGIFALLQSFSIFMSFLTILQAAVFYGMTTLTKKNEDKIVRTIEYLHKWRNEDYFKHYSELGTVIREIYNNKEFEGIINHNPPYVNSENEKKVDKLLAGYFVDQNNASKCNSLSYVLNFWQQIAILLEENLIDKKIVEKSIKEDIVTLWSIYSIYCKNEDKFKKTCTDINNMIESFK